MHILLGLPSSVWLQLSHRQEGKTDSGWSAYMQVMHSDIKARNVLLSANRDVAKISDVGVAKFLNEMATQTQSAYVAWTFAYAAPEILMNQKSGAQVGCSHGLMIISLLYSI